jgi:hypothetical protein
MKTVSAIESAIAQLPEKDFHMLAAWVEQRLRMLQAKVVSEDGVPDGMLTRDHTSFLNGYAPEDEGLYDDVTRG